jgi:hypothetical protein
LTNSKKKVGTMKYISPEKVRELWPEMFNQESDALVANLMPLVKEIGEEIVLERLKKLRKQERLVR